MDKGILHIAVIALVAVIIVKLVGSMIGGTVANWTNTYV